MSILGRLRNGWSALIATQRDSEGWFVDYLGGGKTIAGERINNNSAMQLAAVYACIRVISEDIAKLPLMVYREDDRGARSKMKAHPIYRLLHDQPNPDMTALSFREALTAHCLSWGNGYAEIITNTRGGVEELRILRPDRVSILRDGKSYLYMVTNDNGQATYIRPQYMLHLKGLGYDGIVGYNVIHYARESMGHAMAMDTYGSAYFGNGATPGGMLIHPNRLSPQARKNLENFHNKSHGGASRANKTAIYEEGLEYIKIGVPPNESQFVESRQFSIPEICRWFRLPPHKIADLTRATYSNIEQQSLDYVTDTLTGWLKRWEQEIWRKLFTDSEKNDGYYAEHIVEGLLRGDIQTRYRSYAVGRQWGFLSVNEIRQKENLNPIDGGDQYLVPVNMTTPEKVEQQDTEARRQMATDMADRISKAEIRELSKHVKHAGTETFNEWADSYYKKHNAYIKKTIKPLGVDVKPESLTLQKEIMKSKNAELFLEVAGLVHANKIKTILIGALNNES